MYLPTKLITCNKIKATHKSRHVFFFGKLKEYNDRHGKKNEYEQSYLFFLNKESVT